jgi:ribosomal protein L28
VKKKTRQLPNLRKKRFFDEESGQWVTLKVSASAIRTINKLGLKKALEITPSETGRSKRAPKKASRRKHSQKNKSRDSR